MLVNWFEFGGPLAMIYSVLVVSQFFWAKFAMKRVLKVFSPCPSVNNNPSGGVLQNTILKIEKLSKSGPKKWIQSFLISQKRCKKGLIVDSRAPEKREKRAPELWSSALGVVVFWDVLYSGEPLKQIFDKSWPNRVDPPPLSERWDFSREFVEIFRQKRGKFAIKTVINKSWVWVRPPLPPWAK